MVVLADDGILNVGEVEAIMESTELIEEDKVEGYKYVKTVNSDIEMLEFMRESEDNVCICNGTRLYWEDGFIVDDLTGLNLSVSFKDKLEYKCYSKINDPLDEVWIAQGGEMYYHIFDAGKGALIDKLNNFKISKQRDDMQDKILWILALSKIKQEIDGDFEPDWEDFEQVKYDINFNNFSQNYEVDFTKYFKEYGKVYFSSREKAQQALSWLQRLSEHYKLRWF